VPDAAKKLVERIQAKVYRKQARLARKLKGKYVERNGITFLIIGIKGGIMTISDTRSPSNKTDKVSVKAFLSKKVRILEGESPGKKLVE
jgi:hypothetical protein